MEMTRSGPGEQTATNEFLDPLFTSNINTSLDRATASFKSQYFNENNEENIKKTSFPGNKLINC